MENIFPGRNRLGFPGSSVSKESACSSGDLGSILGWEDPLEKEMVNHSSILAWKMPWTEEPGGLQSMESQSGTTDWLTLSLFRNRLLRDKRKLIVPTGNCIQR